MTPVVPLLGKMTHLDIVANRLRPHVIYHEPTRSVMWVSRSPRIAAFMREWFKGWDASALVY